MKHKTESWNGATSDSTSSSVRRSLTRAGLQLGQLSHVVSGALGTLQGGASPRGAAQNRMRALLNQDRALLSHRACGQATLENEDENEDEVASPQIPLKGSQTRSAAQNRMRELLNQDRAMLALREARRREDPASEPIDDEFAAELVQLVDREWTPVESVQDAPSASAVATLSGPIETSVARGTCLGAAATTTFPGEPTVASVCTPGPVVSSTSFSMNAAAPAPISPASAPFVQAPASATPASFVPAPHTAPSRMSSAPASFAPVSSAPAPQSSARHAASAPGSFARASHSSAPRVGSGPLPSAPVPSVSSAPGSFAPASHSSAPRVGSAPASVAPAAISTAAVPQRAVSKPVFGASPASKAPTPSARAADADGSAGDPIRTRGMAKLLALQGYRDRALSIYDELIAAEPDNAELRAEADRLRS